MLTLADSGQRAARHSVTINPTYESWRQEARRLLQHNVSPALITWNESSNLQGDLLSPANASVFSPAQLVHRQSVPEQDLQIATAVSPRVPAAFLKLAASVACHADAGRWHALYVALYRLTHGEPALLDVATDPDVYRLMAMDKAVRRAVHKMHAFVRFRRVDARVESSERTVQPATYVAWFEPMHHVVQRAAPFFARRFASMQWSILTPLECAHWDGNTLHFTSGVSRATAPQADELEELWRSYYSHIFNPARLSVATMQAEMPRQYWANLPEAQLIATLTREAPARVARMLAQLSQAPAEIPQDMQSCVGQVSVPERSSASLEASQTHRQPLSVHATRVNLETPGAWDSTHDPGVIVARDRARQVAVMTPENPIEQAPPAASLAVHDIPIRIGTASWTDPTILHKGVFYPEQITSAEQRLQHYASRYSLVEVDSTYYVPPVRSVAAAWANRTPASFTFNIKAFALMTGHAAEIKRMPDWLRRMLPRSSRADQRVYAKDFQPAHVDEIWNRFVTALQPLHATGKLGPILLQYPRWFAPSRVSADALRAARQRLGTAAAAVEFRNPDWVTGRVAVRTLALLEELQLTYVIVDAPPGMASSMPPVVHITTPDLAMIRLHGRRRSTWEAKNNVVSERYRYLYDSAELNDWSSRIGAVAGRLRHDFPDMAKAKQGVHVVFNNCHANYGTTNVDEITALLRKFDRARRMI